VQPFVPQALVGSVVDGRYRLRSHLASGGMGAIFRAEHVHLRKEVALKLLRPELSALPDLAERFRREAEIAASLEHENIVRVTDFGRSPEGWLFLAMELLEGESLFERMRSGPIPPAEAIAILSQSCAGLEAAHARGVVHRDLKPENVFLCRAPRTWVKILDFGIAKITDPLVASDTAAGVVVGTPEYVSPEQATGSAVDARADVYAIGLVAWTLLAGRHPFVAEDSRRLLMMQATQPVPPLGPVARVDAALEAVVMRACAKEPADRFPSAGAMRDALLACLDEREREAALPPAGHPTPRSAGGSPAPATWTPRDAGPSEPVVLRTTPPARPRRRWRWAAAAGAAALALAASAWGGLELRRWRAEAPLRDASRLLAAGRAAEARDAIAPALARVPADPRALTLRARALHRIPGEQPAALAAFEAAAGTPGALDAAALADVASLLGADRKTAERAARLLAEAGEAAVTPALDVALRARGWVRVRALDVLRELGAEDRIAPLEAWGALLGDGDCELRKAAARRLGDRGDAAALPRLRELAQAKREVKGLLFSRQEPACGAAEAAAAARRIEALAATPTLTAGGR
jgi:serine/threonine-protein kinase